MDKSFEKQDEIVQKSLVELRKKTAIPKPVLLEIEKYFHYLYSIGYYEGLHTENNETKHVAIFNNSGIVEILPNVKMTAKYLQTTEVRVRNNLAGLNHRIIDNKNKTYQVRYTRRKPTILKSEG